MRELERRGEIGSLLDDYYVTCGNHGILSQMATHAREIAADLLTCEDVDPEAEAAETAAPTED